MAVQGKESIIDPLCRSNLSKKGLCDYVINVATGCIHGCKFCYVTSTPTIRMREKVLRDRGVADPQMDWGQYLFVREGIPEILDQKLSRKRSWDETAAGKGVVLLCSTTDPYQNRQCAQVTREAVKVLLKYDKRVRILTRSPLWVNDLDILVHPNVTVGMSLPHLSDELSRQIEPGAPFPSDRLKALTRGQRAGCRLFIAMAPTPPMMESSDFNDHLEQLALLNPEIIFWEPINARGTNGKRMLAAGLEWAKSVMTQKSWASRFVEQWDMLEAAADATQLRDRLHIWPDPELKGYVEQSRFDYWWNRPTVETWPVLQKTA
ncbi:MULTISPECIES: radical SAM protein [Trichocoleus]|uniref:Radical SAM core domain-containing protein n=1 Tax=Trichocoleus desertorum GB2-A4 TaxID=2933944 RepID=A0ABV0JD31_9CYAN|nr:radical SAM protein [Trichocoleus sp. FACHB-46]MBD1864205.1 radical SAM protein [Trichocoleus sp. FACHB-46]